MEGGIASTNNIEATKSPIDTITVYNDRAEVTRKIAATLPSDGKSDLFLNNFKEPMK